MSQPLPDPQPEPLSAEGAALLDDGRALEAVDVLRRGVAAGEPSAPDLLVRAYLDSGSWHAAVEWLGPLVEQGHVRFAGRLGVALAEIGDADRAEDALRLAIDSGDVAASNDLAILLRDGDRFAEAVQVLTRAADAGDQLAPANVVELYLEAGDIRAAITAAERFHDERRPDTVVALADVRAQQGLVDDADRLYARAAQLGALRAHTARGQFLLGVRGDPDGAEREFREAQRHNEPGWAYTLGRFLIDDGRPDEAREYLQIAIDQGDRDAVLTLDELNGEDPTDD
ncbi:tetratricopeptide repeat protein [Actinomycetes bacterium KLBMP 9759]